MEYFYKKAASLLPASLHPSEVDQNSETRNTMHPDDAQQHIQQSSSGGEPQPAATAQHAMVNQSSSFAVPEPTRAKHSALLDQHRFAPVRKQQQQPAPDTSATAPAPQQAAGGGTSKDERVPATSSTQADSNPSAGANDKPSKTTTDDVNDGTETFYGSAIEQRKNPMPTSFKPTVNASAAPGAGTTSSTAAATKHESALSSNAAQHPERSEMSAMLSQQQDTPQIVQQQQETQPSLPRGAGMNPKPYEATTDDYPADQGSFHPTDSTHPATEAQEPAGNKGPVQARAPLTDKRHGSKGTGHGIKHFFESIIRPHGLSSAGGASKEPNAQQKEFKNYDISSAQREGGLASGVNPPSGSLAAAGVGGAALATGGLEATKQERAPQQPPVSQPTSASKGDGPDLGKSGDQQQQRPVPMTNGVQRHQPPSSSHAEQQQQRDSNADPTGGIESSAAMQRTNHSPASHQVAQQQQQQATCQGSCPDSKDKNVVAGGASQQQQQQQQRVMQPRATAARAETRPEPQPHQMDTHDAKEEVDARTPHTRTMTEEAAAATDQEGNPQEQAQTAEAADQKPKKWLSAPMSSANAAAVGAGATAAAAVATAVGAGVAHARGDTSRSHDGGPSSSDNGGDTAGAQDDVGEQPPAPRRRSLQDYISGMIDTRRGSFKETMGKLLHRQGWENDGQALRMHGQQKIDQFHAAHQRADKGPIRAM